MSCHLFFERFQVERSRDMNRRKFHETFGELAYDLLHENDTPKHISEPCIVVDGSTQTGAFDGSSRMLVSIGKSGLTVPPNQPPGWSNGEKESPEKYGGGEEPHPPISSIYRLSSMHEIGAFDRVTTRWRGLARVQPAEPRTSAKK